MLDQLFRGIVRLVVLTVLGLGFGMALGMGEAWLAPQESVVATVKPEPEFAFDPDTEFDEPIRDFALEPRLIDRTMIDPAGTLKVRSKAALPKNIDWRKIYPDTPQLRISGTTHGGPIKTIDVDDNDEFLVTGSYDKTVRVWSLSDGRLTKVLRPPMGEGNLGNIFAVAISPKGKLVAIGGWSGDLSRGVSHRIHIFELETGELVRSIEGLNATIHALTFSRDGQYLAAGLGGVGGIRVWNTANWEMSADEDYQGDVYGLAFSSNRHLATTSFDGHIRLYDPANSGLTPVRKLRASSGARPHGIAFSPNGAKLAVGYGDVPKVSFHNGGDLSPMGEPGGLIDRWIGNLSQVAWSRDGANFYAAGSLGATDSRAGVSPVQQNNWIPGDHANQRLGPNRWFQSDGKSPNNTEVDGFVRPILWWGEGARAPRALYAGMNTVGGLRPAGKSGIAFATMDPSIGVYRRDSVKWRVDPNHFDLRPISNRRFVGNEGTQLFSLAVSQLGKLISVASYRGDATMQFDIDRRIASVSDGFDMTRKVSKELFDPRWTAPGLRIERWRNSRSPILNDKPIILDDLEISRSLAIDPEADGFVLGSEWTVRYFDRLGAQKWKKTVPAPAWQINISGDGKLVMAALGDGTVRWFKLKDGKELLTLYVSTGDGNPWVAWTPKGYYDASPGGEDLIGWHVNQGPDDAALFYPTGEYREIFYRPNIVASVLGLLDEEKAITASDANLNPEDDLIATQKPIVELLSPDEGEVASGDVTITYQLTSKSGKRVRELQILGDSQRLRTIRDPGLLAPGEVHSVIVTLPRGTRQISLLASTADGYGAIKSRGVQRSGIGPKPPSGGQNTLYAVVIGVSKYQDTSIKDLNYADDDARDVTKALMRQKGGLYKDVKVKKLIDEDAKGDNIEEAIDWLKNAPGKGDSALLYIAGHGLNRDVSKTVPEGDFYFLPHDVNRQKLASSGITEATILSFVETQNVKKMIFIDACYSGDVDMSGLVSRLGADENGVFVYAASTASQVSLESSKWKNGYFSRAFIEALGGGADKLFPDNYVDHLELGTYLAGRVSQMSEGAQTPASDFLGTIPSTRLAAVKEDTTLVARLGRRLQSWLTPTQDSEEPGDKPAT